MENFSHFPEEAKILKSFSRNLDNLWRPSISLCTDYCDELQKTADQPRRPRMGTTGKLIPRPKCALKSSQLCYFGWIGPIDTSGFANTHNNRWLQGYLHFIFHHPTILVEFGFSRHQLEFIFVFLCNNPKKFHKFHKKIHKLGGLIKRKRKQNAIYPKI